MLSTSTTVMVATIFLFANSFAANAVHARVAQDWIPESNDLIKESRSPSEPGRSFGDMTVNGSRRGSSQTIQSRANLAYDRHDSGSLNSTWRWVASGRVDFDGVPGAGLAANNLSLSLREAYLTGMFDGWYLDVGRLNIRDGVALGFNPTDVFRNGALLARRTEDPARLRESRLGVVAIQFRSATKYGGFASVFAPAMSLSNSPSWYDPRLGAVNDGQGQVYVKYTPPRWKDVYTNMVLHRSKNGSHIGGFNLSTNLGQQVIAYVEHAWTKQHSYPNLVSDAVTSMRSYSQSAIGASYSTESRQTFTLEFQRNGAGLGLDEWKGEWQNSDDANLGRSFAEAGKRQDPLGSRSVMLLLQWDQFAMRDADLTCLARANLIDKSRLSWCEWRYKLPRSEWSISASTLSGKARSEFGAANAPWSIGAKLRLFF